MKCLSAGKRFSTNRLGTITSTCVLQYLLMAILNDLFGNHIFEQFA